MDRFILTLFCNDPVVAERAVLAGIDRIGPDLERNGKHKRQARLNTRISDHDIEDVRRIAETLGGRADLLVRINSYHADSEREIKEVIALGANRIMVPYFHSANEVNNILKIIDGSVRVTLLLETIAAAIRLKDFLELDPVDEIHIGLQDLHISANLSSPMELFDSWFLRDLTAQIRASKKRVMVGGVAKITDDHLPMPAIQALRHSVDLGSEGALVSRSFMHGLEDGPALQKEVIALRCAIQDLRCGAHPHL